MKISHCLFPVLVYILCPFFMFGQIKHEIKIVPLDLFSTFTPSYELVINKKIGVELQLSFDDKKALIFNATGGPISTEEFDRKRISPSISGKYYFLVKKYGGLYIGPFFKSAFTTSIEDTFEERYFQINNNTPPYWGRKGFQNFSPGLNGGFKWLIKEHFIVEYSCMLTSIFAKEEGGFEAQGTDLDIEIRVGYRF